MTSNKKPNRRNDPLHPHNSIHGHFDAPDTLDCHKKDRWELLNSFIDGELSINEQRYVKNLLRQDRQFQCLYARLLDLRRNIQSISVPEQERASADDMVDAVFSRVDRQRSRRRMIWAGGAIAALFCAALSTNVTIPQYAFNNELSEEGAGLELNDDGLLVSIDEPVVVPPVPDAHQAAIAPDAALAISLDKPLFENILKTSVTSTDNAEASPDQEQ